MLLAKLALPALLVAGGIGAAAYAATSTDDAATAVATGAPNAWIDAPLGDKVYAPGSIEVYAHATANDQITSLELEVDGKRVATDDDLDRTEKLYEGTFTWDAEVGTHQLQVRPIGAAGTASAILIVEIGEGGVQAPPPTTTTTTEPGATTTSSSSTTSTSTSTTTTTSPTTTQPGSPVTAPPVTMAPPSGGTTSPPVTVPPTSPPTTTVPPVPAPSIDAATVSSLAGDNRLYVGSCGYTMDVSARVRDAASVRVQVEGTRVGATMTRSSSTYRATLRSGQFSPGDVGVRRVLVIATSRGGTVTVEAGRADIRLNCPKD